VIETNQVQIVFDVFILLGGVFAYVSYVRSKRLDALKWIHEVFEKFNFDPEFQKGKELLDFDYDTRVKPLVEAWVIEKNAAIPVDKRCDLLAIDQYLNHFEHLSYLKEEHQVYEEDLNAYFGYWLGLLSEPERGGVRRYLAHAGYERLASYTKAHDETVEYLFVYGSLKSGCREQVKDIGNIASKLRLIGTSEITGTLYDFGDYPGLVLNSSGQTIKGEVYAIDDLEVLRSLDAYEEFYPVDQEPSEFVRTCIQMDVVLKTGRRDPTDTWIYVYAKDVTDVPVVEGGTWLCVAV